MIMKQIHDTLYGVPKTGKANQWSVYVCGSSFFVEWGKVGGKLRLKETPCKGKNLGRANETSPEDQAIKEAKSKWEKQYKEKFYRPTVEEAAQMYTAGVMLSKKFIEDGDKLPDLCYISKKLDGVRGKAVKIRTEGYIKFISRGNDAYPIWDSIAQELDIIFKAFANEIPNQQLDGELYIHGVPLQRILSYVRVYDPINTEKIVYNLFDIPCLDKTYRERYALLEKIKKFIIDNQLTKVTVVEHILDHKSKADEYNDKFVALGYEGVMFNDPDGYYEFQNKRSSYIMKYKTFEDSEALIIDCKKDNNGEGVLWCSWKNPKKQTVEFGCKIVGDHNFRLYENQLQYVNQWVNFKYQQLTVDGKPQFPVGKYIRVCDANGKPLE